jgi:YD repeat-containing protein
MERASRTAAVLVALTAAAIVAATIGASGAPARPSVDTYITAKVVSRVPGKNMAVVDVNWAFKCLSDKLGDATYEWTINLVRTDVKPERSSVMGKGTSKKGTKRVQLVPGQYIPVADPYFCETERGAGSDNPEVGAVFTVPDYCAWAVKKSKGRVLLEQGSSVRAARPGATLRPGGSITVPAGGSASLASNGVDGTLAASASTSVGLTSQCAGKTAWALRLEQGSVTGSVPAGAKGAVAYSLKTSNASVTARPGSSWRVDYAASGRRTTVRVLAGSVQVSGSSGKAVAVGKGRGTTVVGSGSPSAPR